MGKAEDLAVFQILLGEYGRLFSAGDVSRLAAYWTDDFTMMPPNEPTVAGKERGRKWHQDFFDQFTGHWTFLPHEAEIAGEWAFVQTSVNGRVIPKSGGEPIEDRNRIFMLCRQPPDGSWKFHRAMWNSPLPG